MRRIAVSRIRGQYLAMAVTKAYECRRRLDFAYSKQLGPEEKTSCANAVVMYNETCALLALGKEPEQNAKILEENAKSIDDLMARISKIRNAHLLDLTRELTPANRTAMCEILSRITDSDRERWHRVAGRMPDLEANLDAAFSQAGGLTETLAADPRQIVLDYVRSDALAGT
jgi:hypothetical protein